MKKMKRYKYHIVITAINRMTDAKVAGKHVNGHRPTNYINETVDSLINDAGANPLNFPQHLLHITIFDSGSKDVSYLNSIKEKYPFIDIVYSDNNTRLNLRQNTNRALRAGSLNSRYTILLQDDVRFSKNSFLEINDWVDNAPQDYLFLTLWNPGGENLNGYVDVVPNTFWGNLFLIFKSEDVKDVVDNIPEAEEIKHDMALKEVAAKFNRKIYANPDGLINHSGHYSSIGNREVREHKDFKREVNVQSSNKPKVAVAITTFNDVEYTSQALESLLDNDSIFYVYVLDDGSTEIDTTVFKDFCDRYYKHEVEINLTSLWNMSYKMAVEDNVDYLIIGSNDIVFSKNSVDRLIDTMASLHSFEAAGPVTNAPGPVAVQHFNNYCDIKNPKELDLISETLSNREPIKVERLNGFCMLFKTDFLKKHQVIPDHPFNPDPKYGMFGGEDEFFKRAKPKTMLVVSSYVMHYKQVAVDKYFPERSGYDNQKIR